MGKRDWKTRHLFGLFCEKLNTKITFSDRAGGGEASCNNWVGKHYIVKQPGLTVTIVRY
jgi:hypothetical protein